MEKPWNWMSLDRSGKRCPGASRGCFLTTLNPHATWGRRYECTVQGGIGEVTPQCHHRDVVGTSLGSSLGVLQWPIWIKVETKKKIDPFRHQWILQKGLGCFSIWRHEMTEMCTGHILEKAAEDDRAFTVSLRKVGWWRVGKDFETRHFFRNRETVDSVHLSSDRFFLGDTKTAGM